MKLDRSTIPNALLTAPELTDAQMEVLKNTLSAMLIALAKAPKDAVIGDTTLLMSELMVFGMKAVLNNLDFEPRISE